MHRLPLTAIVLLGLSGPVLAQAPKPAATTARLAATPVPAPTAAAAAAEEATPVAAPANVTAAPAPAPTPVRAATSFASEQTPLRVAPAPEQTPARAVIAPAPTEFPAVTFGVQSFLQYRAELHEMDGYNAFDVTRGYFNVAARLSDRVRVRFTPDVRPTTDVNLDRNLALRLEYASLDVQVTDGVAIMFGLHEMPWLTFEESLNRYRVLGPLFAERLGLIPGPSDLGASVKATGTRTEVHVGVYNGEGYGRAEADRYKSLDGRATFRPFDEDSELGNVSLSGFYQYGWYARDRPRNVAIAMGTYENDTLVLTAQYLQATDNPFVAVDVERRGMSFFGEARQGPSGWAVIGGLDFFDPDASNDSDSRRRLVIGGAHWQQVGRGRLGIVVSLEQESQTSNSQLLGRRLLGQTHVEF
jgi:hypothetical protein